MKLLQWLESLLNSDELIYFKNSEMFLNLVSLVFYFLNEEHSWKFLFKP